MAHTQPQLVASSAQTVGTSGGAIGRDFVTPLHETRFPTGGFAYTISKRMLDIGISPAFLFC